MAKLRVLSGADLLRILGQFGFGRVSPRGDHVKLRRMLADGRRQSLTELDRGTLLAIFRQARRFIAESDLRSRFYTE